MSLAKVERAHHRQALGTLGVAVFLLLLSALDVVTRGAVSLPALVPPFGASVVIVFFMPESAAARPWNVVVGHVCCTLAAATVLALIPDAAIGVQAALAVSAGGLLMMLTKSMHPPGGATALLAVVTHAKLGFAMALCPMLVGSIALVTTRGMLDLLVIACTSAIDTRNVEPERIEPTYVEPTRSEPSRLETTLTSRELGHADAFAGER